MTRDFELRETEMTALFERELSSLTGQSRPSNTSARPTTIASARKICNELNDDSDVPYTCATRDVDGQLVMAIGFQDVETLTRSWDLIADNLATPYCEIMNSSNRSGSVLLIVSETNSGRVYACETSELSDWIPLNDRDML